VVLLQAYLATYAVSPPPIFRWEFTGKLDIGSKVSKSLKSPPYLFIFIFLETLLSSIMSYIFICVCYKNDWLKFENDNLQEIERDQLDFHLFALNKMRLCTYMDLLKEEDKIRSKMLKISHTDYIFFKSIGYCTYINT
jgi:hypothetical protein